MTSGASGSGWSKVPTAVLGVIHAFGSTSGQESHRAIERASRDAVVQWLPFERALKPASRRSSVIDRDALCRVLGNRPSLTSVDLSGCYRIEEGEWGPVAVALRGKPLVELTLNRTKINDGDLLALVTECPNLVRLCVRTCPHLTVLEGFAAARLTHLDLLGCGGLQDDGLRRVGERCPVLANLNLGTYHTDMTAITSDGVCVMLERCGAQLRTLSLYGNEAMDNSVRACIARYCVALVALDIRGCRMDETKAIVKACASLRYMHPKGTTGKLLKERFGWSRHEKTFHDFYSSG